MLRGRFHSCLVLFKHVVNQQGWASVAFSALRQRQRATFPVLRATPLRSNFGHVLLTRWRQSTSNLF